MMHLEGKQLYLVRGLPGEGKSTLALELMGGDQNRVIENDQFWTFNSKGYQFIDRMWQLARHWSISETYRRLLAYDSVAVANVFYTRWLMEPYLNWAADLGVQVIIKRPSTPWVGMV